MMARETTGESSPKTDGPGEPRQSVTLEPKTGYSDRDVLSALKTVRAKEVHQLAPGFLSALIPSDGVEKLHLVAEVHPKVLKQMH